MEEYKQNYNYWLKRYYNGIKYLENNPQDFEKYIDNILTIINELNKIITEHQEITREEILNGYK